MRFYRQPRLSLPCFVLGAWSDRFGARRRRGERSSRAMGPMAALEVMYRHPIVCGSLLLLLVPSLFHVVVYFSPLLISTSLFVVALISMGPHMEETREERERWAKGERPYCEDEESTTTTTTMRAAAAESTFVQRWGFLLPGDPAAWVQVLEDAKLKLLVWIDNALKASASSLSTPAQDDAISTVLPSVDSFFAPKAVEPEEDIPSQQHIPAVSKDDESAAAKQEEERPKSVDLDMPELEIIDEIEEPTPVSTTTATPTDAGDRVAQNSVPIFDEPASSSAEDREVPLDEPVSEALLPAGGEQNMPPVHREPNIPPVQREKIPAPAQTPEKISVQPLPKIRSPEKRVHFNTAVASSPPPKGSPVKPSSTLTASPRDVHGRILKDLHTRLNELQEKRKHKHSEVLSRRMSIKQGRQGSSGSSSD